MGIEPLKFIVDMQAGDVVHLLSTRAWDLHYTFVRERIFLQPHLDRCDPQQAAIHLDGWLRFSEREYFQVEGRRFLQGTLLHHAGAGHHTVEFASGDVIASHQMARAFFAIARHVDQPGRWTLRPQDPAQVVQAKQIEGAAPIVGPNAPFRGLIYQPLSEGVGYGKLRFIPAAELDEQNLGHDTIVVTDDVPNNIPFVGGLITGAFQTPLAHVNVLSKSRNTPNMALRDARTDPLIAAHLDQLVRLEVNSGGFTIQPAKAEAAEAFWKQQRPGGPLRTPRLDPGPRDVIPLQGRGMEALPAIGAKAAQLAELRQVRPVRAECLGALPTPRDAFAIPVAHYIDHALASGATALLAQLQGSAEFRSDPETRRAELARLRQLITDHPVDATLLDQVERATLERFGSERVRFRSSSNAEDLADFNGAGLYDSLSAEVGNPKRSIEDALRRVWASLWNMRAYDEREFARIDHSAVAMGVLVHAAYRSERANGVAVSRNVLDPLRDDIYYVNVQLGEASVTNPAPGIATEQLIYRWFRVPEAIYQSRSSFDPDAVGVMRADEIRRLNCMLAEIHDHFRPLIDPGRENYFYAMEVEFKLIDPLRELAIKQARPYSFGGVEPPADCR